MGVAGSQGTTQQQQAMATVPVPGPKRPPLVPISVDNGSSKRSGERRCGTFAALLYSDGPQGPSRETSAGGWDGWDGMGWDGIGMG